MWKNTESQTRKKAMRKEKFCAELKIQKEPKKFECDPTHFYKPE
jgi:hypothetical protein